MNFINSLEFAKQLDIKDTLAKYRKQFFIPQKNGEKAIYLCGNSLGLQPRSVRDHLNQELNDWAAFGVEGHFEAKNPWYHYHKIFKESVARLVGALPHEVAVMNSLTVNLHLLLVSFYRPTKTRYKIICEEKPFPSDTYALQSQIKFHGHDPEDAIVELKPRKNEYTLRTEDIVKTIEENKDSLALVMIGGVNYYTGQAFDMKTITEAGHKAGAIIGFDLAHAAGNLKLNLHDWNVDFACWCSYKYLNSGPGSVGGIFVHDKHSKDFSVPRFAGWWGNKSDTRFQMNKEFDPAMGADGWALSNDPVLTMAAHKASLDIFNEAGMDALCEKRYLLTGYLEFIMENIGSKLEIITPKNKNERGCQLSIIAHGKGKDLHKALAEKGVISDWREPNVIRVAPVPLYNSFEDVWKFGEILEKEIK